MIQNYVWIIINPPPPNPTTFYLFFLSSSVLFGSYPAPCTHQPPPSCPPSIFCFFVSFPADVTSFYQHNHCLSSERVQTVQRSKKYL